jgi:DNA polymerase-3 subunit delta
MEMLIEHLGLDISNISNELSKLMISLPEGGKELTAEDIERYTGFSKDFNNFELCKALMERNEERALMIADNFARNPKEHPMPYTLPALFGEFKKVFIINYYAWLAKTKRSPMPSDMELARALHLSGTWFLSGLKQGASLWPNKITFKVLGLLREYDAKSKGMNSGGLSDGELLRELILKIFLAR